MIFLAIVYVLVSLLYLVGLGFYLKKFGAVFVDRKGDMKRYANQLRILTLISFAAFFGVSQLAVMTFMDDTFAYGQISAWLNIILVVPGFIGFMIVMYRLSPMFLRVEYIDAKTMIIENVKKALYAVLMTLNYFIYVYVLTTLVAYFEVYV